MSPGRRVRGEDGLEGLRSVLEGRLREAGRAAGWSWSSAADRTTA